MNLLLLLRSKHFDLVGHYLCSKTTIVNERYGEIDEIVTVRSDVEGAFQIFLASLGHASYFDLISFVD